MRKRRGLAAAGRPDQRHHLAVAHREAQPVERLHVLHVAVDAQREAAWKRRSGSLHPFIVISLGSLAFAVIARESEAIQSRIREASSLLDCFVAALPRNDSASMHLRDDLERRLARLAVEHL